MSLAAERVRALVSGLPSDRRDKRLMVLFQGYFDDSGSDAESVVYSLSGLVSTSVAWAEFSDLWDAKLKEIPSINYFKMSEAMSFKGEFERFRAAERDKKVYELAEIAAKHTAGPTEVFLKRETYEKFVRANLDPKLGFDPYFSCYSVLLHRVCRFFLALSKGEKREFEIDFIFDEQGHLVDEALFWWEMMKATASPEERALLKSPPIFRNDRDFLPLQAADLYSWLVRNRETKEEDRLAPVSALKLFNEPEHLRCELDEEYLSGLGKEFASLPNRIPEIIDAMPDEAIDLTVRRMFRRRNPPK